MAGVCLAVLGAGIGLAGQAQAAGTAKPVSLSGVSCVRPTWCMAVGTAFGAHNAAQNLAEIWNGKAWRLVATPAGGGLGGVACSATWYCLAFNDQEAKTSALRWNGHKWLKLTAPRGATAAISCVTRTFCIEPNSYAQSVLTWNGKNWTNTQLCGGSHSTRCVSSISCASTSLCMAVGSAQNEIYNLNADAEVWDGKQWTTIFPPDALDEGDVSSFGVVSCAGQICLALGSNNYVWNTATKTWQDANPPSGVAGGGLALSCSSATDCMAMSGFDTQNGRWHDGTWTNTDLAPSGANSRFAALSCKSGSCLTVGFKFVSGKPRPIAESWNGTAWKLLTPRAPAS
ncbi:MAG TPA: hypothetical protein VFI65_16890 [Streptosporangiaceae bacterium]|nr:hypothetical protein [Streptosporangiaceae bacterium]